MIQTFFGMCHVVFEEVESVSHKRHVDLNLIGTVEHWFALHGRVDCFLRYMEVKCGFECGPVELEVDHHDLAICQWCKACRGEI